jgi:hypothetical protein
MSNYSTFFPSGTGGSTEITDPDKINKITAGANNTAFIEEMFYNNDYSGNSALFSDYTYSPITGSSDFYGGYSGGAVSQTADNTEITLANVTGSGGYLCSIVTPVGGLGSTQEIKITVDGGTEKVYSADYSSNTNIDNFYTRLIWGFTTWGSVSTKNLADNTDAVGIMGLGGIALTYGDTSYPPVITGTTGASRLRLHDVMEFKNYNFPKLRFESSILVKCKTNGLYSTSGFTSKGTALYYLDSQL